MLAAMLTALLMVSGVVLVKEILGTPKNDRITGTDRGDVISARGGNDTVVGRGGNDEIYGQPGGDSGSDGDDDLRDGPGQDEVPAAADGVDGVVVVAAGELIDAVAAGELVGTGRDLVNCGLGNDDQVIADEVDGVQGDCERITER